MPLERTDNTIGEIEEGFPEDAQKAQDFTQPRRRAFQAEETACAKALWWEEARGARIRP